MKNFGPIYKETNFQGLLVDPWSVFTNLIFLAIVIYWAVKIGKDWKNNKFIVFSLPVLLVGYIGGTIFHAARISPIWLALDFLPIFFLSLATSIYFWRKLNLRWAFIPIIVVLPFVFLSLLWRFGIFPESFRINLGYATLAIIIIFPIFYYIFRKNKRFWPLAAAAVLSFAVALFFRYWDLKSSLPMGTHWLWHIFGGIATYFLIFYIYSLNKK